MKTRNGFVSNSSSTSFVILLPENFDVETDVNWEDIKDSLYEYDKNVEESARIPKTKEAIKTLIKKGYVDGYDDGDDVYALEKALKKYIVAEIETGGGGDDAAILVSPEKVKKIMEKTK